MIPLFLKKRAKNYCFFLLSLATFSGIRAGDTINNDTFREICRSSDAYFEYIYTDVSYSKTWMNYKRHTSLQSKLVINTRSGVEEYAFVNMDNFVNDHLKSVEIKTLKADGTSVELDSDLIFNQKSDAEQLGVVNYPIPGVEPGDTVEIIYVYTETLHENDLRDYVNLFSPLPCFNAEFTIRTTPDFSVRYKTYNGFPEPQVISNDTMIYCLFKKENIKAVLENQYTCLPCDLPNMFYSLEEEEKELISWKELYNQEFNIVTQPFMLDREKSGYYRRWKRKILRDARDNNKYHQLKLLLNDIYDNIPILPPIEEEMIKTSGYFLKKGRFDPISIRRMYRQLLEDLEINYWAVFARSKRLGSIDPHYIRKGEYDHIFFAYENEDGSLNLLYPHDLTYKYQVNEIPTSLYNTKAVAAKPYLTKKVRKKDKFIGYDLELAEVDSVVTGVIGLPGMSADHNYLRQILYCEVDVINQLTSFKSTFKVSGGLSTDLRTFLSLLNQDQEMSDFYDALAEFEEDESSLEIDTFLNADFNYDKPFEYEIKAEGTLKNSLSFTNDSLISITLDNLIQHSQIESESDSTMLNYYLDYSYNDYYMLILKFPCNIELLGSGQYFENLKNDLGEYSFTINLIDNDQIIIKSDYKITKDIIPVNEYDKLKELNQLVKEVKNTRLLVKLKES